MKHLLLFFLLLAETTFAQTAAEYNERAINHMYAKEYVQAIENFTKVIELNPKDTIAYFDRGMAKEYNKDLEGAIEDYSLQLTIDPNMVDCYYLRALLERRLNQLKKAEKDFLKTIELEEDNADAHFYLSQMYEAKKKHKLALKHINAAIIFNPEVADYYVLRIEIEKKLNLDEAVKEDVILLENVKKASN
jgi:tetratricopeptide (TPR) repeat protein